MFFSGATIWAIQIQVSFPGVKNPKNPGIQPNDETLKENKI